MALHGEDTEEPFWNVTLKGMPTARIALTQQPRPDEIREAFISPDYAENVAHAIEKLGAKDVLSSINAQFYANEVKRTDLAASLREEVMAELDKEYKGKLAGMRDELIHCVGIVLAGANKNFFSDADHVLKAALWQNLKEAGIDDAMSHIEAAFDQAGPEFFNWVVDRAVEFMDKPADAVAEIAKAIGTANTMPADREKDEEQIEEDDSLAEKLARGSINIQTRALDVTASTKDQIRKSIKLGGSARR
jgi:hypothetical protein